MKNDAPHFKAQRGREATSLITGAAETQVSLRRGTGRPGRHLWPSSNPRSLQNLQRAQSSCAHPQKPLDNGEGCVPFSRDHSPSVRSTPGAPLPDLQPLGAPPPAPAGLPGPALCTCGFLRPGLSRSSGLTWQPPPTAKSVVPPGPTPTPAAPSAPPNCLHQSRPPTPAACLHLHPHTRCPSYPPVTGPAHLRQPRPGPPRP